jgi:hypothetical protein
MTDAGAASREIMRIRAASDVDPTFRRARTGPRHRPVRFERQGAFQSNRNAAPSLRFWSSP